MVTGLFESPSSSAIEIVLNSIRDLVPYLKDREKLVMTKKVSQLILKTLYVRQYVTLPLFVLSIQSRERIENVFKLREGQKKIQGGITPG